MKQFLKVRFPALANCLSRWFNHIYHVRFLGKERAKVFLEIYKKNHWKDSESVSGPGSTIKNTQALRVAIPGILMTYKIRSVVDIPCGDFNWFKELDLGIIQYTGLDIVPNLIEQNSLKYSFKNRSFHVGDITMDPIPEVDLIFCRDCFVHLSFSDIRKGLLNIKKSNSKYLFTTTFIQHTNYDIITGNWRPVNLQSSPFGFPSPLLVINEDEAGDNVDKSMALWSINDLP